VNPDDPRRVPILLAMLGHLELAERRETTRQRRRTMEEHEPATHRVEPTLQERLATVAITDVRWELAPAVKAAEVALAQLEQEAPAILAEVEQYRAAASSPGDTSSARSTATPAKSPSC
jgi:hypothetical protein